MHKIVDIVLCCYNSDLYHLKNSIDSVLVQTSGAWMLYIVNDGSKPYVEEFLQKNYLSSPKIHYQEHSENRGLPIALNTGHNAGNGEFISWTSDDNYYEADFVEEMLKMADKYDFVRSLESHFVMNCKNTSIFDPRTGTSQLPEDRIIYDGYLGASHIYRREFYNATTGYDLNMAGIEDLDMYYQIMKQKPRVGFIDKILYNYQQNSSKFSREKVIAARERFLKKWKK